MVKQTVEFSATLTRGDDGSWTLNLKTPGWSMPEGVFTVHFEPAKRDDIYA